MSTTTVYPVASSGPDDDVYTARYPHTSDPSGKTLRESGRKILNMAKPKTVPKKYIRTAEGTRPRTRTKVKKEKLAKIRAARESAFMEGGAGSGRHKGGGDSRDLFEPITMRKPSTWAEVHSQAHTLTPEQHSAFKNLPKLDMSSMKTPHSPHPELQPDEDGVHNPDVEFHGVRGDKHYYVNTEGYDHARYVAHVKGAAIE